VTPATPTPAMEPQGYPHRTQVTAWPSTPAQVGRWVAAHLTRAGRTVPEVFVTDLRLLAEAFPERAVYRVVCWPGETTRVHLAPVEAAEPSPAVPVLDRPGAEWGPLPEGGWWIQSPTHPSSAES